MKSDITRDSFDANRHFSRVLMQQGRVQLDADWNEQSSILLHYLQTLASDLIGPHGGPADIVGTDGSVRQRRLGFEIISDAARIDQFSDLEPEDKEQLKTRLSQAKPPLLIGAGRYYVDGLLCEQSQITPYAAQPGFAQTDDKVNLEAGRHLVVLDVWERLVTFIDDDSIREVALNGADTAARAQITTRVRIWPMPSMDGDATRETVQEQWAQWEEQFQPRHRGYLRARVQQPSADEMGPCIPSPLSGYRGHENQLYRVEIHRGSDPKNPDLPATFKWSRDNGSVVTDWKGQSGNDLEIGGVHDFARGFMSQQWVELSHDALELDSQPGDLVQLMDAQNGVLTIGGGVGISWTTHLRRPKIRRWDQRETENQQLQDGAIPIVHGQWIELEDGIQVWFEAGTEAQPNQYRSGDYWLIPARIATGDVEWPLVTNEQGQPILDDQGERQPKALPPRGIEHHYAPLAIIQVEAGNVISSSTDCRRQFAPLSNWP